MKIAYIYDAVYPYVKGGAEKRVYELSWRLAARGHDVHCYGIKWWEGEREIIKEGVHLHGVCAPISLYSGERRSIREALWFASKLLSSLSDRFDIVDCQEFPYFPCFSAKILTKRRGGELFITWHEVWGAYWQHYLGRKGVIGEWVELATSKLTEKNIVVSEKTRRDLETIGVENIEVIPNGIDFYRIEQVKASEKESDIIFIGRLVKHKNVDLLINAIALIRQRIPYVSAVIIGGGPEKERLKTIVKELGLEENVEFTGFVDDNDALALMKSSKVFVSPSAREGFGMAALEAKACGLPVVTVKHRMNAVCDLVTKDTGFISELQDANLAQAIMSSLDSDGAMRTKCIQSAKKYDWEKICDLAEEIYI
ncbi:MAG: glycosyltransferase family 4 protein [Methanotrichaceae archaeon]|nr:glycosyltransferase family 4 protein [Methanotrichaceae archaeon]